MKIVLDASACVEFLAGTALGARVAERLAGASAVLAPELLISETLSALRGLVRGGGISPHEGAIAVRRLDALDIDLVSARVLAPAVWELSHGLGSCDAHYIALARVVSAPVITTDARLAREASGLVEVVVLERGVSKE